MADANNTLKTNFNVTPYYDDFDPYNNYYRILFRPGYAVQARELTQIQSMLQNQISNFGKHVFLEGSIVLPGRYDLDPQAEYVKVSDVDSNGNTINVQNYDGKTIYSATTGLRAIVRFVVDGKQTATVTKTLYVSYINSGNNGTTKRFSDGETLLTTDASPLSLVTLTSATGLGSLFTITAGVFFAKNHFISFPTQTIVIDNYTSSPTCQVGFLISEDIIRYYQDQSLLDPAQEASNYSAPGADRFKLTPTLTRLDYTSPAGPPDYVALFSIKDGIVQKLYDRPQYSIIEDSIAKRTYDTSGDYFVNGLDVTILENLNNGSNFGYSPNGSSQLLTVSVGAGEGFVKGYQVGKLVPTWLTTSKANTYQNVTNQITATNQGNYINIKEVVGDLPHDIGTQISLYDTYMGRISNGIFSGAQTGNRIGTARAKHLIYNTGSPGTSTAQYKLYFTDLQMLGSNSFASVKSVYVDNASTADFGADIVSDVNGTAVIYDSILPLLYYTGSASTRSIRSTDGTVPTIFSFKSSGTYTTASNGFFTIPVTGGAGEVFPYGSTTLDSTQKTDIIVTVNQNFNVSLSGTVTGTGGTSTVTGSGTFFNYLNVGDKLQFSSNSSIYTITSVAGSSLVLDKVLPATFSGNSIFKVYKTGDIINLNGTGATTGSTRTVTATPSVLLVDTKENFGTSVSVSASFVVSRTSAKEVAKTLRPSRYVTISCSTAGTSGPFDLGFSDVYRIKQIRLDTTAFSTNTQGSLVTSSFTFDNGQRDDMYDHATITPTNVALTTSSILLVELDYFYHDTSAGLGYYSIDSYPINDNTVSTTTIQTANLPQYKSTVSGSVFDLRNYLDFRVTRTATATDATTVGTATSNPASGKTVGFDYVSGGLRLVAPSRQSIFNYSYYLPRRDVVVVDENNNFYIVNGVPSVSPITPVAPDNTMSLASIFVAPYPSLAPIYAQSIGRTDISCAYNKTAIPRQTMRDIGVIKQRVDNLEYYVSLNTLEKSAIDLRVINASTGLDRFKNGIFVDTFNDDSLGAKAYNPDYCISIDPAEKSIRPIFTHHSIPYTVKSNTNVVLSTGGEIATLPYTEETFIEQPYATTYRNMETNVYRYYGNMSLSPDQDFWVDVTNPPDGPRSNPIVTANNYDGGPLTTYWNDWQSIITGYTITGPTGQKLASVSDTGVVTDLTNLGWSDYGWGLSTFAQMYAQVYGNATLETNYRNDRTGTQYYLQTTSQDTNLGTRVINTQIQPYIRPQTIQISATGLKPNTKFYTFFDGINLSANVTPILSGPTVSQLKSNTSTAVFDMSTLYTKSTTVSTAGSSLISTANGIVNAYLQIPSQKFKTGTKEVIFTDSPTNESDATSVARSSFTAQGLIEQKQDTVLTTRQVFRAQLEVANTVPGSYSSVFYRIVSSSCMAYSFVAKAPDGEEGMFLSSIDLYIAGVSSTLGYWVEVREMSPDGSITKNTVPFSVVEFSDPNQITVTSDPSKNPHHIKFPAPIFLYNNTQYALIMHPMGSNQDMYFWVSVLGQTDIISGSEVTNRSLTGTLYMTNNNMNWDIVPNVDLRVKFYRALFDTTATGSLVMGNYPIDILSLANVSSDFTNTGEIVATADQLTLSGIYGGTINTTDLVIGANSGANGSVITINGSKYAIANSGYTVGENVTVRFANAVSKSITATISAIDTRGTGSVYNYKTNATSTTMTVYGSNGNFVVGNTIIGLSSRSRANVTAIANQIYSTVDFEPSFINFSKTSCSFEMKTDVDDYFPLNNNQNYYFPGERKILARTNEVNLRGGAPSNNVRITLKTTSKYQSPIIDIGRTHSVYVRNLINSNNTNEINSSGGSLKNKYISKVVTLADGQDAEDIKVLLTAYRPPDTEVYVYGKFRNGEDADAFNSKPWVELPYVDSTKRSSIANFSDFIEYQYALPRTPYDRLKITDNLGSNTINIGDIISSNGVNGTVIAVEGPIYTVNTTGFTANSVSGGWANIYYSNSYTKGFNSNIASVGRTAYTNSSGFISYTTDSGVTFTGYKQFAIKIGLSANSSAIVPKVADLRVIALQV